MAHRKLADTTGKATVRAYGIPDYPFVMLGDTLITSASHEEMLRCVEEAIPQIEQILLGTQKTGMHV